MATPGIRRCHKQDLLVARIEQSLGVTVGPVACHIVDQSVMTQVMGKSGWSRNETMGVVGFQHGKNVYVLDSAPWTVLHELVHRSGVNADRLNRYIAEGLTEVISAELASSPDEHKPTYPEETKWVRDRLLRRLGMTGVQLGGVLAKSRNPPATLAKLMVEVDPSLDINKLKRQLRPQKTERPSFNRTQGHITRGQRGRKTEVAPEVAMGWTLFAAGSALLLTSWWRGRG